MSTRRGNIIEALGIHNGLSILAYHDPNAVVKGLNDFPAGERPPVLVPFLAFRGMVGLGLPVRAARPHRRDLRLA